MSHTVFKWKSELKNLVSSINYNSQEEDESCKGEGNSGVHENVVCQCDRKEKQTEEFS